jgi:hypothetical protein
MTPDSSIEERFVFAEALITRVSVDAAVRLLITSPTHVGGEVVLNSRFVIIHADGAREPIDPGAITPEALVAIHGLLWLDVVLVDLLATGALVVRADQVEVRIAPDDRYDAWVFEHSDGTTAWAAPGGEISYSRPRR